MKKWLKVSFYMEANNVGHAADKVVQDITFPIRHLSVFDGERQGMYLSLIED